MNLNDIELKKGDLMFFKCNARTFIVDIVGGFSHNLDESICEDNKTDACNGYDHVGILSDEDYSMAEDHRGFYLIHAHPPRASRDKLDLIFWKEITKAHDIEIWRYKGNAYMDFILNEIFNIAEFRWNHKNKRYEGLKYNWWAILLSPLNKLGIGIKGKMKHCAELIYEGFSAAHIYITPHGQNDPLCEPNEIINSGLFERIYTIWRNKEEFNVCK